MTSLPESSDPAPSPAGTATGLFCEHRNIRRTCATCSPRPVRHEDTERPDGLAMNRARKGAKGKKAPSTKEKKGAPTPMGTPDSPHAWWVKDKKE